MKLQELIEIFKTIMALSGYIGLFVDLVFFKWNITIAIICLEIFTFNDSEKL